MTVLALDAGNTSVKAARWDGTAWSDALIWPTAAPVPAALDVLARGVDAAGLASVVPLHTGRLAAHLHTVTGQAPTRVSAALPLPFAMAYQTPGTLGADRLAAAVAAWILWGGTVPVVVLDAGTAVTLDVVVPRAEGPAYLGGAIAPGPDLLCRSLTRGTGQLPRVAWETPLSPIGTSTADALQVGLTTLFAEGVAGLLRRTAQALEETPVIVATGGWAPWLAEQIEGIDAVVPTLVLDGIRLLIPDAP